ncbi:hypothetical protein NDU88_001515 [Pleurodeles waltl]|uniref:Uncharacterized protein n=1 Tax=Pleurodeles waltl TaxID=8319 RepID=A0AAV7SZG1_PLEWA|nr:hypothetical protein NDU88_001515 [Pleurodeles waltl]
MPAAVGSRARQLTRILVTPKISLSSTLASLSLRVPIPDAKGRVPIPANKGLGVESEVLPTESASRNIQKKPNAILLTTGQKRLKRSLFCPVVSKIAFGFFCMFRDALSVGSTSDSTPSPLLAGIGTRPLASGIGTRNERDASVDDSDILGDVPVRALPPWPGTLSTGPAGGCPEAPPKRRTLPWAGGRPAEAERHAALLPVSEERPAPKRDPGAERRPGP